MPTINIVLRDGTTRAQQTQPGCTLLQVLIAAGVDGIGLCNGSCACGTCHVYVDPSDLHRLAPMDDIEDAILDVHPDRRAESRQACQIPLTDELDGLHVTVAPAD